MARGLAELEKALFNNTIQYSEEEKALLRKALDFASKLHKGTKRRTGDDYITHPLSVAISLAVRNFDSTTVIASLLHDTMEDCDVSYQDLAELFGPDIAKIIDGVTKISNVPISNKALFFSTENYFAERVDNYRKLLLSTAKDIRVVIVKLFDRLHNIETIEGLPKTKRQFYAIETIEIYAQIADRIGLAELKRLLEDMSFPYAYPEDYTKFKKAMKALPKINQKFIGQRIEELKTELTKNSLEPEEIQGRIKHEFSIYKKFRDQNLNFENFFDLYAIRVIVKNIADCYKALGIVHALYPPIAGRIFDFIAEPKANGYQSLQTTVKIGQYPMEIQIRTRKMHETAEYGPAAHWQYKEMTYGPKQNLEKSNKEWLEELSKIKNISDKQEFLSYLKNDLFAKKIFVLSPKGDIFNMPQGSTVIDFAYRIHSNLGEKVSGAKINGEISELSHKLKNGDMVEIMTSNRAKPSIDWLRFTVTSYARQKIKKYLRAQDFEKLLEEGKELLEQLRIKHNLPQITAKQADHLISDSRMPYNNLHDLLVAYAEHVVTANMIIKVLYPTHREPETKTQKTLIPEQDLKILSGISYELAKCCKPKESNKIVGYVGRDHTIKVHNKNCKFIRNADPDRFIYIDPFDR